MTYLFLLLIITLSDLIFQTDVLLTVVRSQMWCLFAQDVIDDEDTFYAWKQVQKEIEVPCVALVQDNEDDVFSAWKLMQREMGAPVELECISPSLLQSMEEDSFYAWKQIQKEIAPVPKSPVKKAVAASVAVAVAGSVAGAASAVAGSVAGAASVAGRAVASSGGTNAVATSLTVLQHSALPGSTLLAKIVQHLGGGGVAGAIGATAVYPLDTIKTRMQAQSTVCATVPLILHTL